MSRESYFCILKFSLATSCSSTCLILVFLGGTDVRPPHAFPWTVALLWNRKENFMRRHYCGGALVDSTHIITAAHCAFG